MALKLEEIIDSHPNMPDEEKLIIEAYYDCRNDTSKIARYLSFKKKRVTYVCKKYGLELRGTGPFITPLKKKFEVLALSRGEGLTRKAVSIRTGIIPRMVNKYN